MTRGIGDEQSSSQRESMFAYTRQIAPNLSLSAFTEIADLVQRRSGWSAAESAYAVAELICSIGRSGEFQLQLKLPSVQGELGLEP